jgi:hypothetical protein
MYSLQCYRQKIMPYKLRHSCWIGIDLEQVAHESMVLMNVSTRDKFFLEVYLYYNPVFLTVSDISPHHHYFL